MAPPAACPCCDDGELAVLAADGGAGLAGAAEEGEPAELPELQGHGKVVNLVCDLWL